MAKAFHPQIITANRLRDGAVVYLTSNGSWAIRSAQAVIARTPDEQARLLATAAVSIRANEVVDAVAIDADADAANQPISLRERIRLTGPTVRPDLARHSTKH